MQTTNHGKAPLRGTATAAATLIRLGLSLTVGNNPTLHLPINPHLSPCHGFLSAVLDLLHDSSFEGPLLWLDVVKKKDVRSREEALLCLGGVCYGRSISPITKHDPRDGGCLFCFFNLDIGNDSTMKVMIA